MFEIAKNVPNPRAAQCCANCVHMKHPLLGMAMCLKHEKTTVMQLMTCNDFEMNLDADTPALFAKRDEELAK